MNVKISNGSASMHTYTLSTSIATKYSKTATINSFIPKNVCYSRICSNRPCSESFSSSSILSDTTLQQTLYVQNTSISTNFFFKCVSDLPKSKWPSQGISKMIKILINKKEIKLSKSSFLILNKLPFLNNKLSNKEQPLILTCKQLSESFKKLKEEDKVSLELLKLYISKKSN